jgi:hypothetical protein
MKHRHFLLALLLWALLIMIPVDSVHAAGAPNQNQQVQTVQTLEDALFTMHYDQEPIEKRLSRLEETVFGQSQTNLSADARISKLQNALSANTLGPLSPTAKKPSSSPAADTGMAVSSNSARTQAAQPPAATGQPGLPQFPQNFPVGNAPPVNQQPRQTAAKPLSGETDYPTVTQMELKVFGKSFLGDDITQRLTRLEQQVFKTVQTGALADRVDNLRLVVLGDTGNQAPTANGGQIPVDIYAPPSQAYVPTSVEPTYSQIPNNYTSTPITTNQPYAGQALPGNYPPGGNYPANAYPQTGLPSNNTVTPDMMNAMNEVEKQVLGHTFPAEPFNSRLDRVEMKVFHSTSPEMSNEDRMQRVIAVASAGGTPSSPRAKAVTTFQTLLPIILTILPMILL